VSVIYSNLDFVSTTLFFFHIFNYFPQFTLASSDKLSTFAKLFPIFSQGYWQFATPFFSQGWSPRVHVQNWNNLLNCMHIFFLLDSSILFFFKTSVTILTGWTGLDKKCFVLREPNGPNYFSLVLFRPGPWATTDGALANTALYNKPMSSPLRITRAFLNPPPPPPPSSSRSRESLEWQILKLLHGFLIDHPHRFVLLALVLPPFFVLLLVVFIFPDLEREV
jgi:hypothetical protein